jgi:hypothetical protein
MKVDILSMFKKGGVNTIEGFMKKPENMPVAARFAGV